MRKVPFITLLLLAATSAAYSQRVLSLDSCRALAIRNNKQLNMSRLGKEVAMNIRKAARTKYLPKVDALGGYELTSREISMLSNDQKGLLNNIGTAGIQRVGSGITTGITRRCEGRYDSPATGKRSHYTIYCRTWQQHWRRNNQGFPY